MKQLGDLVENQTQGVFNNKMGAEGDERFQAGQRGCETEENLC